MGLIRKTAAISLPGLVHFRSSKEKTARNTKATAKELRRQNGLLQDQAVTSWTPTPAPTMPPPPPPAPPVSIADELAKLAELRDQGIIAPHEFEAEKARLLGR